MLSMAMSKKVPHSGEHVPVIGKPFGFNKNKIKI